MNKYDLVIIGGGSAAFAAALKLEELYDPEPMLIRDAEPVNPPSGKVVKGIFASLAPEPSADDSIDFTASAPCAKTTAVFPTRLCEERPCGIL